MKQLRFVYLALTKGSRTNLSKIRATKADLKGLLGVFCTVAGLFTPLLSENFRNYFLNTAASTRMKEKAHAMSEERVLSAKRQKGIGG